MPVGTVLVLWPGHAEVQVTGFRFVYISKDGRRAKGDDRTALDTILTVPLPPQQIPHTPASEPNNYSSVLQPAP